VAHDPVAKEARTIGLHLFGPLLCGKIGPACCIRYLRETGLRTHHIDADPVQNELSFELDDHVVNKRGPSDHHANRYCRPKSQRELFLWYLMSFSAKGYSIRPHMAVSLRAESKYFPSSVYQQ
jgi:hypothetical protein